MISGSTGLIIEDEYMIALEVQRILEAAGGTAIIAAPGIAGSIAPASEHTFNLAIVSVPPHSSKKVKLCRELRDRGVAVVVLTSSPDPGGSNTEIADFVKVVKPFADEELLAAATAALQRTNPASPVS